MQCTLLNVAALAAPHVAQAQRAGKTRIAAGPWKVETSTSRRDDSRIVLLTTEATSPIESGLATTVPSLTIRCLEGRTDVIVYTGVPANPEYGSINSHTVRYRIDSRAPVSESWGAATSDNALFAQHPRNLIRQMVGAGRLLVEFTPFRSGSVVVEFPIRGLSEYVQQLAAACNWKAEDSTRVADSLKTDAELRALTGGASGKEPDSQTYFEFQVEKQVSPLPNQSAPVFPAMLRSAHVEGEVLAQFVVDRDGVADMSTFKVLKSTHILFTNAVKAALINLRFSPAEIGGRKVRQLVQMPFQFNLKKQ